MDISQVCDRYFSGFQEIKNFRNNSLSKNLMAILKIFSYFTVLIPFGFGIASLLGRVSKKTEASTLEKTINGKSKEVLEIKPNIIETPESKKVRDYTNDLTEEQKTQLKAEFINESKLKISFNTNSEINFTVRREDIFNSKAEVIVNAANTHLGGGGGIDGAIHTKGGEPYAEDHRQLKDRYNSNYVSGYAAMIGSGLLKDKYGINNVIVVAGPIGESTPQNENELYSCYYNSLVLAHDQNKTSIAFSSISTGIYGFPKDRAAAISLKAVYDFVEKFPATNLKTISIHFYHTEPKSNLETYRAAATAQFPTEIN